MKRQWTTEELVEHWSLEPGDEDLLFHKEKTLRLGLFAQLTFYRHQHRFPDHRNEFAPSVLVHLAEQIGAAVTTLSAYRWDDRTGRRHRRWVLKRLEIEPFDGTARAAFTEWLMTEALPREPKAGALDEWICDWLARAKVARPGDYRFDRLVRTTRRRYEAQVFDQVLARLDEGMRLRLNELLGGDGEAFQRLRGDPGRTGLDSLLEEIEKLRELRALGLPADILKPFHSDLIKRYRRRAATEGAWDLRHEHPDRIRLALLTFYCARREAVLAATKIRAIPVF